MIFHISNRIPIEELTQHIEQQLSQIYKALALHQLQPSASSSDAGCASELAPTDLDLLALELHAILNLLTFAFSKMLPRFDPSDLALADPNKLVNHSNSNAQRLANVYDVTLRASRRLIPRMPFTEGDLLSKVKK